MDERRCHRCGVEDDGAALDWSSSVAAGVTEHLCGPCTRRHVRDIEAKVDEEWWDHDPTSG